MLPIPVLGGYPENRNILYPGYPNEYLSVAYHPSSSWYLEIMLGYQRCWYPAWLSDQRLGISSLVVTM
jgi:hypothetical protein